MLPIETTSEHPFYVSGKGWTSAEQLETGDMLLGHDGTTSIVGKGLKGDTEGAKRGGRG